MTEEKLNLAALRRTAIRLRLEQGESLEGMQAFMATSEKLKQTRYRMKCLNGLVGETSPDYETRADEARLPVRQVSNFKEGENTTHGLYSRKKNREAIKAVMLENIVGMEEEIKCLRILMRGILECDEGEDRLVQAYSQATQRLKDLLTTDKPARKREQEAWAEKALMRMDEIARENGQTPVSARMRAEALGISAEGEIVGGIITEEIATSRLLLRQVYRRARQGVDTGEYLRLVDLYGSGCVKRARLVKMEGDDGGRLVKYLRDEIDRAIREVRVEFGLDEAPAMTDNTLNVDR
jgi:hypothetical protein